MSVHPHSAFPDLLKLLLNLDRYENGSKLSGVIYIHRISDNLSGGIAGRNFGIFCKLCGDAAFRNVILVTNMWGDVSHDIGEARDYELFNNSFKLAIYKGAQMVRHHNTVESAHDIIRKVVASRPIMLQIQRELVDEQKDIIGTAAGGAINEELGERIRRHQAELKEVREEMVQAMKDGDEETRQEMEEDCRRLQGKIGEIAKNSEGMVANYAAEKQRMEARVKEMEHGTKEGERDEDDRTPNPQIAYRGISYVQAPFHLATHGG